jgi:predicted kinase
MVGLPGSGKSTLAKRILAAQPHHGGVIISTDDFFTDANGAYHWIRERLHEARAWCEARAQQAMAEGRSPIIIDNPNLEKSVAKPYVADGLKFGYTIHIVEPDTKWWKERILEEMAARNLHRVNLDTLRWMAQCYEPDFTVQSIMNSD